MASTRNYAILSNDIHKRVLLNYNAGRTPCNGLDEVIKDFPLDEEMQRWARHYAAELHDTCKSMRADSDKHLQRHDWKIRQLSKAALASMAGAAGMIGGQLYGGMHFGVAAGLGAAMLTSYIEHYAGIAAGVTREMERGSFYKTYDSRFEKLSRRFITRCAEHVDDIAEAQRIG